MKKFKKLISTVTLFAFCTLSYSPAFASVVAEQPTMDEYAPQEITEIVVKDPETKAWLESEESPYNDIPVTLVDEFPTDVEAEFDAMLSSADEVEAAAVPEDGVVNSNQSRTIALPVGIPLATWLSEALYALLLAAATILTINEIELARATDVEDEAEKNNYHYYQTYFGNGGIYVGGALTLAQATDVIVNSVALGHNGTGPFSWKQWEMLCARIPFMQLT